MIGDGTVADAGETIRQAGGDEWAAQPGDAWGDPISAERQAELRTLAERQQAWVAQPEATRGDSAFEGVRLTGADVYWLAEASGRDEFGGLPNLHLEGANLNGAQLEGAHLSFVHLEGASLNGAQLEGADLEQAQLAGAYLTGAQLNGAHLIAAQLKEAYLGGAELERANLIAAQLTGAHLAHATFDKNTLLSGAVLTGASLDQVTYDGVNLAVVDWSLVPVLGDELKARQRTGENGKSKGRARRLDEFTAAVRANRVLAATLRSQGMSEDADRYAYRAQHAQRVVLRLRRRYLAYLGSLFIDLLAGYGFRPERSLLVYLAVILWFANFFIWASHGWFSLGLPPTHVQPLAWYEGLILSVSSFHGRGFQPFQSLNDPIAALAGIEAIFGLIIEVSFIATFTQRFFAR